MLDIINKAAITVNYPINVRSLSDRSEMGGLRSPDLVTYLESSTIPSSLLQSNPITLIPTFLCLLPGLLLKLSQNRTNLIKNVQLAFQNCFGKLKCILQAIGSFILKY